MRGFRHLEVALAHFEPLHSKFCLVTRIHLPRLGGDDHEDVDGDGEDNGNGIDLDMYVGRRYTYSFYLCCGFGLLLF